MADEGSPIVLDTAHGEITMLRDVVLRAHQMTGSQHVQSPAVMMGRVHALLDAAINHSPAMRGFFGRGGPEAHRDILAGSGDLS